MAFRKLDWHVDVITHARDIRKIACNNMISVGLLDLSSQLGLQKINELEWYLSMPNIGWVAATTEGQLQDDALRRIVLGFCFDCVTMPHDEQRAIFAIEVAYRMVNLGKISDCDSSSSEYEGEMIGSCGAMRALFRMIRKIATTDAPVFISGESGTGKELTAAAIHNHSRNAKGPFVAINCGAIPPHLLQSELFGFERGAFTGATKRKTGRIEDANGGTLFLDEIGDMPFECQVSLLRFLEDRKVERLGGHTSIPVDTRIISATHIDIDQMMRERRFRSDLYHRLCVLHVKEPPLRERGKDIDLLARHVLERYKKDAGRRLHGFSADAIKALHDYDWPGNVRELINRVRRAIIMSEGALITAADLELADFVWGTPITLAQARKAAERKCIELLFRRHAGRPSEVARSLGISRVTLYRLLCEHGVR